MKKLIIILISFISIWIIGILITTYVINSNVDTGVHKVELDKTEAKTVEISIDRDKDTLNFTEKNNSITKNEKEYIESFVSIILEKVDLKSGIYSFTIPY